VRSGPTPTPARNMTGLYSYPDVLVVCGEPEYMDEHKDVILNPSVIIEVLSPATESFDRGEKCERYQTWNQSLTDYILVSQDKPMIEHFTRQMDNSWNQRRYVGLEAEVPITSIQCSLKLADVYERVDFVGT
jgi:Uma2 family endonuclease